MNEFFGGTGGRAKSMSEPTDLTWRYTDTYEYLARTRKGMPPMMIVVAVNGGIQGKESNDAIPETADEIADATYGAYKAGASMVHVHARNPKNLSEGARDTESWYEVNSKIRQRCPDIIINNTTGGDLEMTMEERLSCLDARPEVASLNLTPDMSRFTIAARKAPLPFPRPEREIDTCLAFTYGLVERFARKMNERGVKPEMETYHSGGAFVIQHLIKAGLVKPPYLIQTVMGVQSASHPTPLSILNLLQELPPETVWFTSGIGPFQLPLGTFATLMGGHVRTGLEDNLYYARGQKFDSNEEAVKRVARIAKELNREIAGPDDSRRMLGLGMPTKY
jgi:3-keto-5-aminohexanoate cleavage enzyme